MFYQLIPPDIANILGFAALVLYSFTLIPSITRAILPQFRMAKFTLVFNKNRRIIGILAWLFGLLHGVLITIERNLNFFDPAVILKYSQGIVLLTVFTILAATSNDFSVKHLKKNWKRLHKISYLMVFVLIWHVIDKVRPQWTYVTPIGLLMLLVLAFSLVYRYFKAKKRRQKIPLP